MKTLKSLLVLLTVCILTSCETPEPMGLPPINNDFEIANVAYPTPNAYLMLDDGPPYTNIAAFAFLNGTLVETSTGGIAASTDTSHAAVLAVRFGSGTVPTEADITNSITNTVHILDGETEFLTNVSTFTNTYMVGSIEYGQPDENSANHFTLDTTGGGSINILSLTVDLVARTGTILCTYTLVDDNNVPITGTYQGNFTIINNF